MASKNFTGYLRDPLGEFAFGDKWIFTHISTTGETPAGSTSVRYVAADGFYDWDIEYGQVNIKSKDRLNDRLIDHGTYVINSSTAATTIPALLNAAVPASDPVLLELETLVADAEAAQATAEAAAAQVTPILSAGIAKTDLIDITTGSCNDIVTTGIYLVTSAVTDIPPVSGPYYVFVDGANGSSSAAQTAKLVGSTNRIFFRTKSSGTWSSWVEAYHSDNTGNSVTYDVTTSGTDTTANSLLKVGAGVEQLDKTNSNIEFTPSVKPTLKLDFANNLYEIYDSAENSFTKKPIADILTITRSTGSTVTTPTGKVASIGVDKPAFDFEEGVSKGLRVNQSYTNLITNSEVFDASIGTRDTGFTESAPDGSIVKIFDDYSASISEHYVNDKAIVPIAGSTYVWSVFAKRIEGDCRLYMRIAGGNVGAGIFRFDNPDASSPDISYKEYPNSWYLVTLTATLANASSTVFRVEYMTASNQITYQGTGSNKMAFFGRQLTATPYPMPYAKTEGSQVTVAADSVSRTLGDEFNSNEFTFIREFYGVPYASTSGVSAYLFGIGDGGQTTASRVSLSVSTGGSVTAQVLDSSAVVKINTSITGWLESDSTNKVAVSVSKDSAKLFVNGNLLTSGSGTTAGYDDLDGLFIQGSGSSIYAISCEIYPKALSEAECIQLTKS